MKKTTELLIFILSLSFSPLSIICMEKKSSQGVVKPNTVKKKQTVEQENHCKYLVSTLTLVSTYLTKVKEAIETMPITDDISLNDVMIQQSKNMLEKKEDLKRMLVLLKAQQKQYLKTRTLVVKELNILQEQNTSLNLAIAFTDTPVFKYAVETLNHPIDTLPLPSCLEEPFLASVVTEKME